MTKTFKTSPSQLKGATDPENGCYRRWGYEYILKRRPEDSGEAAALGSRVHRELEQQWHLKHDPEFSDEWAPAEEVVNIAEPGLEHLPPGHAVIEWRGQLEIEGGHHGGIIDAMWAEDDAVYVQDWKTSSNPDKYALTEETLPRDPQALTYAQIALRECPRDWVVLRWVYLHTKKKAPARVVEVRLSAAEVAERFEAVQMEAESLVQIRGTAQALENQGKVDLEEWVNDNLSPNLRACFSYGKECHAISYCPRPGLRMVRAGEGQQPRRKKMAGVFSTATKKTTKKAETKEKPKPVTKDDILMVLMDCVSGDVKATPLSEILQPIKDQVAEAAGALHWKAVDYGKGAAYLEAGLRAHWEENPPTGVISANSMDEGTRAVRATLEEYADYLFQGVRG